jgi:hypothetical protein
MSGQWRFRVGRWAARPRIPNGQALRLRPDCRQDDDMLPAFATRFHTD